MGAEVREVLETPATNLRRNNRKKFVELAEKRTINAIRAIRTIAKLGNKAHYKYDESDVKKIATALSKEVEALKVKMTNSSAHETIAFRL